MKKYYGKIYEPGGNTTALVSGSNRSNNEKAIINTQIMKAYPDVEQVGFLNENRYELVMAGGEFCGNATRSAAYHYLEGNPGEITMQVSGVDRVLKAGVRDTGEAWAEMPVYESLSSVSLIEPGVFKVKLEGITHIVMLPEAAKTYLSMNIDLKAVAKKLMRRYFILNEPAAGVVFLEKTAGYKIHPCVFVPAIETMFYETACGSGTTAVGLVLAKLQGSSIAIDVVQPSLQTITVDVQCTDEKYISASISGIIREKQYIHWSEAA